MKFKKIVKFLSITLDKKVVKALLLTITDRLCLGIFTQKEIVILRKGEL